MKTRFKKLKQKLSILNSGKNLPEISILFFLCLYLFFPTQNSGIDAYNYAANIRWGHDLFFPHHLFYNFFHQLIIKIINAIGFYPDILVLMKTINALFAIFSLYVLYLILKQSEKKEAIGTKSIKHAAWILFAGSSYGFMRYATENETYIIPVFWSLLSTLFFLKFIAHPSNKYLFISGLMATIACLFHQLHILWYAGLFAGLILYNRKPAQLSIFILPSLLIPFIYYLAFLQKHTEFIHAQNLWQFVLYDYYYGTAHTRLGFHNLLLGFISFVRSFVQVHGNISPILANNSLFWSGPLLFLAFTILAIVKFFRFKATRQTPGVFVKTLIIIFILQFGFAVFSEGNAEFMVMLPLLFILIIDKKWKIHPQVILFSALALLSWNLWFGLLPNKIYDYQNHQACLKFIESKPNAAFILSDDVQIQNMHYYNTGIIRKPNLFKSPASLIILAKDTLILSKQLDSLLEKNIPVYTDCFREPRVLSRKTLLQKDANELFFRNYGLELRDSIESFSGIRYFYLIKSRIE
jgi:hypothetical protein